MLSLLTAPPPPQCNNACRALQVKMEKEQAGIEAFFGVLATLSGGVGGDALSGGINPFGIVDEIVKKGHRIDNANAENCETLAANLQVFLEGQTVYETTLGLHDLRVRIDGIPGVVRDDGTRTRTDIAAAKSDISKLITEGLTELKSQASIDRDFAQHSRIHQTNRILSALSVMKAQANCELAPRRQIASMT